MAVFSRALWFDRIGAVVRTLRRGESILLTFRGKPLGTIEPIRTDAKSLPSFLSYEEAWADIENQLRRSKPAFDSWREAEDVSRGHSPAAHFSRCRRRRHGAPLQKPQFSPTNMARPFASPLSCHCSQASGPLTNAPPFGWLKVAP